MHILPVVLFIAVLLQFPAAASGSDVYNKIKIRNRAAVGFNNSGTAIYNYQVIDEYDDTLTDEEKGNYELTGKYQNVREVYNHVEVKNGITDIDDDVTLGCIDVKSGRRIKTIDNTVKVDGDISGRMKNVTVGAVKIRNGRIRRVKSTVTIRGGMNAK